MESTGVKQVRANAINGNAVQTASFPAPAVMPTTAAQVVSQGVGYGMPCSNCRAYYPADMPACPICKSKERLRPGKPSVAAAKAPAKAAEMNSEAAKLLAEERERLRELKSQIYASQPAVPATTFRCALDQNHDGVAEPAAVCHSCYGEARQHASRVESALRMDPKDGARIVYEAVWADTSDPEKTYYNAAVALLREIRKRAGIAE